MINCDSRESILWIVISTLANKYRNGPSISLLFFITKYNGIGYFVFGVIYRRLVIINFVSNRTRELRVFSKLLSILWNRLYYSIEILDSSFIITKYLLSILFCLYYCKLILTNTIHIVMCISVAQMKIMIFYKNFPFTFEQYVYIFSLPLT